MGRPGVAVVALTFAHCVWVSAPRGGWAYLGVATALAATFINCVWLFDIRGGCACQGRLVAARGQAFGF